MLFRAAYTVGKKCKLMMEAYILQEAEEGATKIVRPTTRTCYIQHSICNTLGIFRRRLIGWLAGVWSFVSQLVCAARPIRKGNI